jgi:hypothetical protein
MPNMLISIHSRLSAGLACCFLIAAALPCCAGELPAAPDTAPRARVVVVRDPAATEAFQPREDHIQAMVDCAITNLTAKGSVPAAWLSLVSTQDVVGIKVFSEPGPNSGTRPAVVGAIVQGLLSAGLQGDHIVIWDKHRSDLRLAGYLELARRYGVRAEGSADSGYDETNFYSAPLLGALAWGDFEFGKKGEGIGRRSFVSSLVSRHLTKIICVTPLMNHNEAGVCGNLFSLAMGSMDNTTRFESDSARLATAVPEIYALPALGDRVVLNIVDALICQYEGEERSLLHYSAILNELRFSRDPVALDMLSVQELEHQRQLAGAPAVKDNTALFANASLLELGVSDLKRVQVDVIPMGGAR